MQIAGLERWVAGLGAFAALCLAGPAPADEAIPHYSELLAGASRVAIGVVSGVDPAEGDDFTATLTIESNLVGPPVPTVAVAGSRLDPSQPRFQPGLRYLVFLEPGEGPSGYVAVAGAGGAMQIPEGAEAATLALATAALERSGDLTLAEVLPHLTRDQAPQRNLVATLLQDLGSRASPDDGPALVQLVCDSSGEYLASAHLWAVEVAARLQLADALACVEEMAEGDDPMGRAMALEALGELSGPRTEGVLKRIVEAAPSDPEASDSMRQARATAALSLGKIGSREAVPALERAGQIDSSLAVGSEVVNALGLIGSTEAAQALRRIEDRHPDPHVRAQAKATLERLQGGSR